MPQTQPVALSEDWQLWDGRIVDGKYPLQQFLGDSDAVAAYLTEINGAAAVIKLLAADATQARTQAASWNLAARLSHPNLVRVSDTGLWHADDEHDMQFAVIEYCEESLDAVLRQRPLTPHDARQMLLPTLEALKYLHHQGVLHGQLTPANILASGDQLKLSIDHVRRSTDEAPASVNGPYDAPEKAAGTVSPSSDIWMLGITLHEALTQRMPTRNQDGTAEITDKLPAPFDEIVRQCLMSDRERRPSLAAIGQVLGRPSPMLVAPENIPAQAVRVPTANIPMIQSEVPTSVRIPAPPEGRKWSWLQIVTKRPALAAAVALALLLTILIGVRRSQENVTTSSSAITRESASSAPPTRTAPAMHPGSTTNPTAVSGSVLHQALPEIPERVKNTINGTVKVGVKVAVTPDGKVARATLSARGPSAYFARQALEAAQHWTFAPPVHDGKPQASDWMLHFEFRRNGTRAAAQRI